jgi:hypothetical protein
VLLDAIAAHLQANGIGIVGTNIFKGFIPDSPDFAIGLHEYPGRPADKAFGTTILIENARFQIIVRSDRENAVANAYTLARAKAETIQTLLDGVGNVTLTGVVYYYIQSLQPPFMLQRDENQRAIIATNYEANKARG